MKKYTILLLGSGELGKEVAIELQRYGVEVVALDRYANAPAMQVAHRSYVLSMLDGKRLREIIEQELNDASPEDFIKKEEVVVSITNKGFAKRIPIDEYRAQKRGGKGTIGAKLVDNDFVQHLFICNSHDYILFISNLGKAYYVRAFDIPENAKTAKGTSLKSIIQMENNEKVTAVISFSEFSEDKYILMGTKYGVTKKVRLNDFSNAKVRGVKAIILDENDELSKAVFVSDEDDVMLVTKEGKGLRTDASSIRTMGRSTHGVRGIKLIGEDELVGIVKVEEGKTILMVTEKGKGKKVRFDEFKSHGRGTMGQKIYTIEKGENGIVDAFAVDDETDVLCITTKGQVVRIHSRDISIQGRAARGVKVVSFKKSGDSIIAMATTYYQEDSDEDEGESVQENVENPTEEN